MSDTSSPLHQQAINAALTSDWTSAIDFNKQILEENPKSVEALNRLGRAYFEIGELLSSKKNFQHSLEIDPYNQIAAKFLKRVETCKKSAVKKADHKNVNYPINSDLFIEEPGKTKLVGLLKVAEPQKLSLLSPGMIVDLHLKNKIIALVDQNEEYLGVLPDDLSHHLVRLIHGGNKYQAIIKTVKMNGLTVLIREIFRSSRFKNQPSFLDNLNTTIAYSSDHIVMQDEGEEEMMNDGEDEDRN
jgi:tetratricopeptide (TPR) repeat protein